MRQDGCLGVFASLARRRLLHQNDISSQLQQPNKFTSSIHLRLNRFPRGAVEQEVLDLA